MMNNRFKISFLWGISSLPEQFFFLINPPPVERAMFFNPGVSLRSYLVAKGLNLEFIDLTPEIALIATECEIFSSSPSVLAQILEILLKRATMIIDYLKNRPTLPKHINLTQTLLELSTAAKMTYDVFILSQDAKRSVVDSGSQRGSELKEGFFNLHQTLIETAFDLKLTFENHD